MLQILMEHLQGRITDKNEVIVRPYVFAPPCIIIQFYHETAKTIRIFRCWLASFNQLLF
jgi:hypothetical protein